MTVFIWLSLSYCHHELANIWQSPSGNHHLTVNQLIVTIIHSPSENHSLTMAIAQSPYKKSKMYSSDNNHLTVTIRFLPSNILHLTFSFWLTPSDSDKSYYPFTWNISSSLVFLLASLLNLTTLKAMPILLPPSSPLSFSPLLLPSPYPLTLLCWSSSHHHWILFIPIQSFPLSPLLLLALLLLLWMTPLKVFVE